MFLTVDHALCEQNIKNVKMWMDAAFSLEQAASVWAYRRCAKSHSYSPKVGAKALLAVST